MLELFVFGVEVLQELVQGRPEIVRGVEEHATGAHVTHGDPRSAEHLKQVQDPFPQTEGIHQGRSQCAQVLEEETDAHQVTGHPLQFGGQGPQVFGPLGNFGPNQFFHRQAVCLVIDHGRNIVQTVGQGDYLGVIALFGQLLGATVEVAKDRLNFQDILAVKGNAQPKHPVCAGVLRPDIDRHRLGLDRHKRAVRFQLSAVSV